MQITTIVGLFFGIWSLVLLIDHYLRMRNTELYLKFVHKLGLVISPFHIRIYTAGRFQRFYDHWPCFRWPKSRNLLDIWFHLGVGVSIVCSFFIVYILSATLFGQLCMIFHLNTTRNETMLDNNTDFANEFHHSHDRDTLFNTDQAGIVPIVPGLNMPWSHAPLLFCVLVIAGVVHELGHALAAANERVTVNGFGVFLLGVYPGAFTELERDGLQAATSLQRLKIFCAGIWHNLVTALFALLCIVCLPRAMSFGYSVGQGVLVTDVHALSGLGDAGGLLPGDVVYEINNCRVTNEDGWARCLRGILRRYHGFCVPKFKIRSPTPTTTSQVRMDADGELKCCAANASSSHLCFYYRSQQLIDSFASMSNASVSYSCLPARYVTDHYACNHSQPCRGPQTVCVYAALFNNTKLFRFQLDARRGLKRQPVLFVGHPGAVLEHVAVSGYIPRNYVNQKSLLAAPEWLPHCLDLFFRYLFTLSLAFALLNAAPCFSLDGQFIWSVLIRESKCVQTNSSSTTSEPVLNSTAPSRMALFSALLYKAVMIYGTVALVMVVFLALVTFLRPFVGSEQ